MHAKHWANAKTSALGLRVPSAIGDYLILQAIRESKGAAVDVEEEKILPAMRQLAREEGIMQSPEGAATVLGLEKLLDAGTIDSSDVIILFGTGSGFVYPEMW